jgi:hypothetical protein
MDKVNEFDHEVGYRKPPKKAQFQKGRSGNPSGRPKGAKNLYTVLVKDCNQFVQVNGPRGPRRITKLEAGVMQLGNKTAQGDLRAAQQYFAMVRGLDAPGQSDPLLRQPHERDEEMIQSILKRMRKAVDSVAVDTETTTKQTGESE